MIKIGSHHQNPPFTISLSFYLSSNEKGFCKRRIFYIYIYIKNKMYVTLKLDDNGCRIHSIADGSAGPEAPLGPYRNEEMVTNERYVIMPWKMVTRHGTNMTLKEAVKKNLKIRNWKDKKKLKISIKNIMKNI